MKREIGRAYAVALSFLRVFKSHADLPAATPLLPEVPASPRAFAATSFPSRLVVSSAGRSLPKHRQSSGQWIEASERMIRVSPRTLQLSLAPSTDATK